MSIDDNPPQRSPYGDGANSAVLRFPDVTGMSLLAAALAYAEAGWYVLPTDPSVDIKSPGSVVYGGWHEKSTRDSVQIERWWTTNPDYGIALHCGRSGAGAFDLDSDSLEHIAAYGRSDIAEALRSADAVQGTRAAGERGHYIFLLPNDGKEYGNGAGAFTMWGEFRGKNGVIIAAPTPHPDAEAKGGQYRQIKTGAVGAMPEALRTCLSEVGESADPLTDAEMESFLDSHAGTGCGRDRCGHTVDGPAKQFTERVNNGESRHESLAKVAPWALSEAAAGCYSAREAFGTLHRVYAEAFGDGDDPVRVAGLGDEFVRLMQWAMAVAAPDRAHRNDDTVTADDLDAFWSARPELERLRQFARARRVGPWSMFGAVLAKAVAAIPPNVVLPPIVGSTASINLFVALVAPSGGGKGASEAAAGDFLVMDTEVFEATPGSGEGILKQYAYVEKKKGQPPQQINLRRAALFTVGEIDTFAALAGRSGSTLAPELRKAWAGERLGFGWATAEKAVIIMPHRYRMTMVAGVQPGRGRALLDDSDGGTPQRFLWMPTTDPDAPDDRPEEPEPLQMPGWPKTESDSKDRDGARLKPGSEVDPYRLHLPPDRTTFHVLALPPSVVEELDRTQTAKVRGEHTNVDPLDSHAPLARLKVAAGLMWLNGRTDKLTEDDWDLAGVVMSVSTATRREVQSALRSKATVASRERGRQDAEREVAKDDVMREKRTAKLVDRIREKLRDENDQSRSALRKRFQSSDRAMVDEAIELLERTGDLELRSIEYQGNRGQLVHLREGR